MFWVNSYIMMCSSFGYLGIRVTGMVERSSRRSLATINFITDVHIGTVTWYTPLRLGMTLTSVRPMFLSDLVFYAIYVHSTC